MDLNQQGDKPVIEAQPGPQKEFQRCTADIAIIGGAAFGGKSYALLMEPLRAINDPNFTAIYFRRETPELTAGGGPWETARKMYQRCSRVKFNSTEHTCRWASGAMMKFSHLQLESDIYAHHSAAYAYIAFDELVTFTARQFWYLMTRNRPADGYSGKCWIRAGTNPDADSWLREVIDWWIGPDGYPIMERSGVVRYMTMKDNRVVWVDKDWTDEAGNGPKSFTFIPAPIETNVIGNATQPDYISSLYTQDDVTRERLLRGNWNITYRGGMFKPDWFRFVDKAPEGLKLVRYWDLAATPKKEDETRDPDYSVGVLVGELDGNIYICDIERLQGSPAEVETRIKRCADIDGRAVTVGIEEEKGSSGKYVGSYFARHVLPDRDVISDSISGDKIERAKPWAADAENGRVFLVRADWNRAFLAEAGSFPIGAHKDQCDAVSGGYKLLKIRKKVWPMFNVEDQSMCRKLNLVWTDFVHYGAVSLAQDMTVYVMAAVYMKAVNKLYVYGELKASNVTLDTIAKRIVRGMSLKDKPVHMLFGEDQMFSESTKNIGATLNLEMKAVCKLEKTRYSAAITPADNYDLHGAHHVTGLMIARKEIVFSEDCQETVRQVMSWSINDKGVPQEGFNLCKCLNMITSAVNKARKQAAKKKPLDPHYRPIRPKENPRKKMDSFQIA